MYYPLKMKPVFKSMLWGGSVLKEKYRKETPFEKTGESWEASSHPNGETAVANGALAGRVLSELIAGDRGIMGASLNDAKQLPLLFKLIDSQDRLSVQVHPNDAQALRLEGGGGGKTEMWYVLDARPGARLVYGFGRTLTKEGFFKLLEDGEIANALNFVSVQPGDVFFMPANKVHAIGEGILIAELQQSSDLTYRVFDWNRVDKDGAPRELHVEKAAEVLDFTPETAKEAARGRILSAGRTLLAECEFFTMEKACSAREMVEKQDGTCFHILFFSHGNGCISYIGGRECFDRGDTFVIPAAMGDYVVMGDCEYLKMYVS